MSRLWRQTIPAWLVLIIFLLAAGAFVYYREPLYRYDLVVPNLPGELGSGLVYGANPQLSNQDFFQRARQAFVEQQASFVEADLDTLKLRVYQDGVPVLEVPILAKGREGSWWETPSGLYKIEMKARNHFSSFGQVNQPWSMAFQGNFFIHGWPEYPDGTPVSSQYSGGCIRLSNEDAARVFQLTSVGMPVLVSDSVSSTDERVFSIRKPELFATHYLAADLDSNFVFLARGERELVPIASITKLLTALIAAEYINLDAPLIITEPMLVSTSHPRLVTGQSYTAYQLLFPLLLESSNESAEALARTIGRDRFIKLMNDKARAIGMSETHFVDPSGALAGNISTAENIFTLAKYIESNRSFIFKLASGELTTSAYGAPNFSNLRNFNDFSADPRFLGGKVGLTSSAGETALYVFRLNIAGEERRVAIVLLGTSDRAEDAQKILVYISNNFQ